MEPFLSKKKPISNMQRFSRWDFPLERFWSRVEKTNSCWIWKGHLKEKGYAQFEVNGKFVYVHRFSYELVNSKIPEGLVIDHLCRNHSCVNPDHLEAVTNKENILRGTGLATINSRKTHCIRGHSLTGDNLYLVKEGNYLKRQCRTCRIKKSQDFRDKIKVTA